MWIFRELNSKGLHLSLKNELENPALYCFHVLQKMWYKTRSSCATTAKKCTKKCAARESCCFANLILFCHFWFPLPSLSSLPKLPKSFSSKKKLKLTLLFPLFVFQQLIFFSDHRKWFQKSKIMNAFMHRWIMWTSHESVTALKNRNVQHWESCRVPAYTR